MSNFTRFPSVLFKYYKITALIICCLLQISTIRAQVSLTATGGTTGPTTYTTLKGAFDAVNAGTHTGAITISVTSAGTTETATAVLNASGSGSASFTRVQVLPATGASPTITGNISSGPVIKLNGANNVTINGSNNGTNTRNLTISNTSITTPQVLVIGSVGTTPVTNDTMMNCIAINGANTSTCIIASDATTPGAAGYFNNIGIINNSIQKAYIGTYLITTVTGTNGNGTYIARNDINTSGTNAVRLCGIYMQGLYGAVADSNNVGNFETLSAEYDRAIWVATGTTNTTVSNNSVSGLNYSAAAGYAPIGIYAGPGVSASNVNIVNNTVTNITSASSGLTVGIYFAGTSGGVTIQRNKVSNIKNTNTTGYGSAGIYLIGSNTTASADVINNFVWDVASYGFNGWASGDNGNGIVIDGGGGYNIYYNTVWLNTNQTLPGGNRASCMLITAGVTGGANTINLRNNIFSNTQTAGNANSRFALVVTAPISVMGTFNYNDYYATSTNLAAQGTNATIWNTITQIQTNMGNNGASVSIQPNFTSSTDLHLPAATNTTLNNLGVNIAAYTTDIDLDPRTPTPDMGADEFGNCQAVTITTQPTTTPFCAGGNTSMTVAATNGNVIQWQVNTGSGFTNITNGGVYSGATTGTLTITGASSSMNGYTYKALVSFSAFCPQTSSSIVTLVVNPLPSVAVASSGSTTFCVGGTDTLSVPTGANLTYQWKNGSGNIAGATSASYVATVTGNYFVTVTNTATGCNATSGTTAITVGTGPVSTITPSGSIAICQGTSTTLSAGTSSGVTYQWQLNGTNLGGATSNTYTAIGPGNYTVVVSTSATCNTTSLPTVVNINPLPTAIASASSSAICQGSSATLNANVGSGLAYQWLLNNAIITGATSNSYTVSAAGNYRVQVTNTNTTCKDTSTTISITVNPLPAATINPTSFAPICQGDTVQVNANTGTGLTHQWLLNGNAISGATASSYKAFTGGNYTVRVTDGNGCQKVSAPVALTVNPLPPANITYSSPISFCEGSAVVLNAYPGSNLVYQWYKDGNVMTGTTGISNTVTQSGSYSIRATNIFNCVATSDPVLVVVFPRPTPVITNNNFVLSTGNYSTYQWYLNNQSIGSASSSTYTPHENGGYKVIVTDANGCSGTSDVYFLNGLSVNALVLGKSEIQVYPNPATSYVVVDNKSKLKLQQLSVINSLGSIVYSQAASGEKESIPTSTLAAGLYYIRIQTSGGVYLNKLEVIR